MTELELDLKRLIIRVCDLEGEGVRPEDIDSEQPLFQLDGLGLDSIDGLELGMALRMTYGITIEKTDKEIRRHFATVRSLAEFVMERRAA
jgi:acyl carrier protein